MNASETRVTGERANGRGKTRVLAVRLTEKEVAILENVMGQLARQGQGPDRRGWNKLNRGDTLRFCLRETARRLG